jgi:hypothetical protein
MTDGMYREWAERAELHRKEQDEGNPPKWHLYLLPGSGMDEPPELAIVGPDDPNWTLRLSDDEVIAYYRGRLEEFYVVTVDHHAELIQGRAAAWRLAPKA